MKTYRQYRELLTKHRTNLNEISLVQIDNICRAMEDLEQETEQLKISSSPMLSEVLPLEGEIYPDTEADGIVFCGKCGKQK